MRKVKGSFAKVLACVFLLFCVFSYNINISALSLTSFASSKAESHTVFLEASFAHDSSVAMESVDGVNFSTTVELAKGNYQFRVIDNGNTFGHPGTINDTTVTISTSGWKLSETINAKCTLVATGGNYTFSYNTENNKLQVLKEGVEAPGDSGESLKLNIGNISVHANIGDKISYEIYLKADKVFEDVQSIASFNEDKLKLTKITSDNPEITDNEAEALKNCPNLEDVVYNSDYPGVVAANASCLDGYDFTDEKLFISLDFTVIGTGETNIEFTVQEMSKLGGEESYFLFSNICSKGVSLRGDVQVTQYVKPTEPSANITQPETTTEAQEPTEVTAPITTEPQETTAPVTTEVTEPSESVPSVTMNATEPSESVPSITTEVIEPTGSTAPTNEKTEPTEGETQPDPTTRPTAPELKYDLGDVNRDGKLNIRDATLIQKYIAKIASLDDEQILLADYKPDGKVNIKDATLIQKKIANLL
ncbi:MAG: hypothetical protein IJW04_01720 [Ruminococcus sp.]|nr:hypothetical protein [Ruminococcus sp.]